jgi:hypothetical protein
MPTSLKRDGVCNPVIHVLNDFADFKRFGRGLQTPTGIGTELSQINRNAFGLAGQLWLLSKATVERIVL